MLHKSHVTNAIAVIIIVSSGSIINTMCLMKVKGTAYLNFVNYKSTSEVTFWISFSLFDAVSFDQF